ncbi:MAG TPA: NUDIX domain-containing protein [Egicoccus sp.]|nr:NUDIX domain-containing protein [Egicoccus sp.]HSK25083.1 NUDIX domain-containing protein [Egicoccus sp.]
MAARRSAGLLLFRRVDGDLEVLLAHMGGPFWARKDAAAWTLPKGEYTADETPLAAARREFVEELGVPVPPGEVVELGEVRQSGGKTVTAFALEADLDPAKIVPGTFELEWPPRSGRTQSFPETDRVAWFDLDAAREKVVTAQVAFLERLEAALRD